VNTIFSLLPRQKDTMPQNFAEKTFTNSHKTAKFVKVFSLESFLLYGICAHKFVLHYSGTSENGLPLLRKPPQYGQDSVVPNCIALYYSCFKETSVLRTPPK